MQGSKHRRIAILFSGRIDKYDQHYTNIMERIVQDHDADFFLSHSPELSEDLEDFSRIYRPKAINNDPIHFPDVSEYKCHPDTSKPHNVLSMWVNRQRVFQEMRNYMINTDTWYDVVIHARIDAWYDEPLDYSAFLQDSRLDGRRPLEQGTVEDDVRELTKSVRRASNELGDRDIYIPQGNDWGGMNDQFAVGSYYSMESYMTLFDDVHNVLDHVTIPDLDIHENRNMPRAYYYGPEPGLKKHLELQGVLVHRFPFRYRLINGKVFHHP